ncbi:zinc-dependent alcohol dehydrogenase family protein [Bradyrhizobium sp. SYSU BS000235]|uniref:zinc-dependent alcohol dehydrogenase family protein n=1 Tax=Bradyrhizobium sp. SYSU BS000235 TaxID=3411332 RepID=UPI003C764BF0
MRAAVLHDHGSPFTISAVQRPDPQHGQVLVRIKASAVNPLDLKIRKGQAAHARHPLPAILGIDLAGIVESVGAGVTRFRPGDEVYGMTGGVGGLPGSLAEFVAADVDLLALKPAVLSMRQAAALPLSFITAWEGLVDRASVQAGQKVLVHGGAGGVGHMAVQLARYFGAEVFATGSSRSRRYIEELEATFIDYSDVSVGDYVGKHTAGKGFDLVYDTAGGTVLDASFDAIARFGHVVSALGWGTHSLAPLSFRAASYSGVFTLLPLLAGEGRAHHGDILRKATKLVDLGKIVPRLDPRHFTLDEIEQAYAAMEVGTAAGKIVIDVNPE